MKGSMEPQTRETGEPKPGRIWGEKNTAQLVVFQVGPEIFGVPIEEVREIIRMGAITPIPEAPDFVRGIINVRGDILPVIDLKIAFDLAPKKGAQTKHIMITRREPFIHGLMVDEVSEVLRIPQSEIRPPPGLLTALHEEYVRGIITAEERLILLLDFKKLFSEEETARLGAAVQRHKETQNEKNTDRG